MPAIKLDNVRGATFRNVRISGFDVGVESVNSSFDAQGMTFDGVRQPWDVRGGDYTQVSDTKVINDPKVSQPQNKERSSGHSFSGWRRNGPPLPSQCPHCKTVFPSRNFDFGTARFLSKNNEETCPECKQEGARLADGLFDLTAEATKIISGPDLTHAMLAAISKVARDRASESISDGEFIERLNGIDGRLGEIAQKISAGGSNALAWFGIALTIMSTFLGYLSLLEAQRATPATIEATVIAREALQIQKSPNPSEELLKLAVGQLSEIKIILKERLEGQEQNKIEQPSAEKSQAKPPAETGSIDLHSEGKPKRRRIRRHSASGHRYNLYCCCRPNYSRR